MTTHPTHWVHELRMRQLAHYLRESRQILADWDAYSDHHSDPETYEPLDETAYGLRQRQRDADTWNSFARVLYVADDMLDTAEQQLAQLPPADAVGLTGQIRELHTSMYRLHALHVEGPARHGAMPSNPAFDAEALAERNAEAWHHLNQWTSFGPALIAADVLFRQAQAAPPTGTPLQGPVTSTPHAKGPGKRR
ncbi:hypothetical protein QMK19_39010 [Streptomyces sp. H10-C2]|uniref:hypothetical protein n=1 Tax=unclassified Streptomyces TaxID=2593676 RepID=UPI0022B06F4C|nr:MULTISPECIES: hypothetical protein [unclassified Streptomyces]MCZ4103539.1 hypothetical protein [Streptomyces sp. H39-C1]MDJ0347167.1 hypothetical protein [Streptomyces sp. PH10-H1]MDJ0375426.1 hypothetical protein [Streptomyces sp. H10-C2]